MQHEWNEKGESGMNASADLEHEIDSFVKKAMQTWGVPGLALVIVKDDQVMYAGGFGVREMGKPDPVDEHTLFAIASNTKAFTALAVGLLVQEGKLTWDDPVTKYIPDFQLYDPHTTQLLTVRDLLCHRCGLGTWSGDMLLLSQYSTDEIIRRLRHIPPAYNFRAGYGYSNLMFITAGRVIETVSGMSWDDFLRERIFAPLGMNDSVTNPAGLKQRTNIAVPHEDVKGKLQTVVQRDISHVGAEGSIHASVADIAQWLRLHMNQGQIDGRQLVDPAIIEEMHKPHTLMQLAAADKKFQPTLNFAAYGLGWFLNDLYGHFFVRHTGGLDGMLSSTAMIPERKIGVAVFTNKLPNMAYLAVPAHIFGLLLDRPSRDWISEYLNLEKEAKEKETGARQQWEASRARDTRPALALEKYAGPYDSSILGGATLHVQGERLHIQLQAHESLCGTLEHWHYDTFICHWEDPVLGESIIPFITDGQGSVAEFRVKIREDWIDPLEHVFRRQS
jgi:CubicO group peptidase (beta-lactamase class C family)